MKIGVTGTREGFTKAQRDSFVNVLARYDFNEFHHGSCKGVDVEAVRIAITMGCLSICHPGPPVDSCQEDSGVDAIVLPNKTHFARNRDIVNAVDLLIVVPKESTRQERGGTWMTSDFCRKRDKPQVIIWPDGKIQEGRA